MKVWWVVYNNQLFDGSLPTPVFCIRDIKHYGECDGVSITLSSNITTYAGAKATLLHEMVHQWQHVNGKAMDHGAEFKTWQDMIRITTSLEI